MNNKIERNFEQLFDQYITDLKKGNDFDPSYYLTHKDRFREIFSLIPEGKENSIALECGATSFFQPVLRKYFGYKKVIGTIFSPHIYEKRYEKEYFFQGDRFANETISIDLESDLIPYADESVDFVMCSEVIEHLDIDPMFMLGEINRILKKDGYLLITTPNSCSARNFWKIANGYRPHFFMQYEKSRSPYRHNIEWDIHGIELMTRSAGFETCNLFTKDVFEKECPEGLRLLKSNKLESRYRGDCIFSLVMKKSAILDRWPEGIYV